MRTLLKILFIGLAAGALAGGVIIGIGGRIAMRGIALMGGLKGGFSWGGTLEVVLLGLIIGAIAGGLFAIIRKYLFANTWLTGLLYGLMLFVVVLILPIEGKGAAKGFPDLKLEVYLIFAALHLIFGVVLAFLYARLSNR